MCPLLMMDEVLEARFPRVVGPIVGDEEPPLVEETLERTKVFSKNTVPNASRTKSPICPLLLWWMRFLKLSAKHLSVWRSM